MPKATTIPRRLVVAVGGNATLPEEIRGTADEQKIEAAIRFLEGGGKRAIITHVEEAMPALASQTSIQIVARDA